MAIFTNDKIRSQLNTQNEHNKLKLDEQIENSQGSRLLKSAGWWDWVPLLELDSAW